MAAHKGEDFQMDVLSGSKSRGRRFSPIVENFRKAPSADSFQEDDSSAAIPFSLTAPIQNAALENDSAISGVEKTLSDGRQTTAPFISPHSYVPMEEAVVEKADNLEKLAEVLEVEPTLLRPLISPNNARRDSSRDATDNVQLVPHDVIQSPVTTDSGSLATQLPIGLKRSGGILERSWNFAGLNAQSGFGTHGEQTHPELAASPTSDVRHKSARGDAGPVANLELEAAQHPRDQITTSSKPLTTKMGAISPDSDSDDDFEITSVKIVKSKLTHSNPPHSSLSNGISNKPRQPPKSDPAVASKTKESMTSPVKTLSQGRKGAPPGLRELPGPTYRPGYPRSEFKAGPSMENSSAPGAPARTPARAGRSEKKGPPGLKALPSNTKFTPTLVGRLLKTKPGPVAVDDDLEEELTSPESSPGIGIARLQIEVGAKEAKFVRQKPLPISIPSDEDSDEDRPTRPHKHTISEFRLQSRSSKTSDPSREPKNPRRRTDEGEIWPEESRDELAQAAINYLNAVPQNKQLPMGVTEMLNLLGEQPEFNNLCSQIKRSGRTLAKPAFASAILSKLEPRVLEEPSSVEAADRTDSSSRSKISTSAKHLPNMSRKMTPGRVVDSPFRSTLSRKPARPGTEPRAPAEFPRSNVARATLMSSGVVSLMSPAPSPSQTASLEHVFKRRKVTEAAPDRNATKNLASPEVIELDPPAPDLVPQPPRTSNAGTHRQTRRDEVLNQIAERLLLHEGLNLLPRVLSGPGATRSGQSQRERFVVGRLLLLCLNHSRKHVWKFRRFN